LEGERTDHSAEDDRILELLRTPGLSIKYLDEETKESIRGFIRRTHVEKGMSLGDVAKLIGNKTSGYTSWLTRQLGMQARPFEEARLKGIHEKVRKYERKPFDGTNDDRAYLLGLRHGDLTVSRPFGDAVRVSTSTTHPEMADLFRTLFQQYGHVYQLPRYKYDTRSYEWNLSAVLDTSFDFLLLDRAECRPLILPSESTLVSYISGIIDAEGHISLTEDKGNTSLMITVYNTDRELLTFVKDSIASLGYRPIGPYLDKKKGTMTSKYKIERKKDYWKIVLARFDENQAILRRLPLRHKEKIERQELATSLPFRAPWQNVRDRIKEIQTTMRERRDDFVRRAETEFLEKHKPALES
jgi:hypothetical protein